MSSRQIVNLLCVALLVCSSELFIRAQRSLLTNTIERVPLAPTTSPQTTEEFAQGDTFSNCCPVIHCAACDKSDPFVSKYRTFDGTCNNYAKPTLGANNTPLKRLIAAAYADGKGLPRGFPTFPPTSLSIPSANTVSQVLFTVEMTNTGSSKDLSVLFMTFGQFLDHDMGLSPHASCTIRPGSSSGGYSFRTREKVIKLQPPCGSIHSFDYPCFPIQFSPTSNKCTPFGRTKPVCQLVEKKKERTVREQANVLTSFIDGSQIYGETVKKQQSLRTFDGTGHMKLSDDDKLPIDSETNNVTCKTLGGCSLVGDVRGDENIALHGMHTVWVREHNKIATKLKQVNPSWEEEELFQNARKINGAQLQHIVYNEFLPKIANIPNWTGYNTGVDPSIANSFSTAAYRFGHGLIPNFLSQLDNNYNTFQPAIKLQNAFFNRQTINDNGIEPTMFGLVGSQCNNVDTAFSDSISRHLFVTPGTSGHMDLTAFNIQRGRDHGLPTYVEWRKFCKLAVPVTWANVDSLMMTGTASDLSAVYASVKDIDLFAGGMAEKRLPNREVGATFACIIKNQFDRLRRGDRFYYENPGQFTAAQLNSIKKVTMSSILCRNLKNILKIQKDAFVHSPGQPRLSCDDIKQLDLQPFADGTLGTIGIATKPPLISLELETFVPRK